jgi:hypothetical protein
MRLTETLCGKPEHADAANNRPISASSRKRVFMIARYMQLQGVLNSIKKAIQFERLPISAGVFRGLCPGRQSNVFLIHLYYSQNCEQFFIPNNICKVQFQTRGILWKFY